MTVLIFLLIALPRLGLPDSLDSLTTFANQVQMVVSSAIAHPLWAVTALVFGIGLLQLLADLIKRVIKATLTFVLTLPLTLSQWIWRRATTQSPAEQATSTKERFSQLIERLDTLRVEQDQVITELKSMMETSALPDKKIDSKETSPAQNDFESVPPSPFGSKGLGDEGSKI